MTTREGNQGGAPLWVYFHWGIQQSVKGHRVNRHIMSLDFMQLGNEYRERKLQELGLLKNITEAEVGTK